jgi:hypothetical protein
MSDVFPTDCSPRKTSLNFRRGLLNESPDVAMAGLLLLSEHTRKERPKEAWSGL